jgi:Rieske Fe-S protein
MEQSCCTRREFCKKTARLIIGAGVAQYAFTSCATKNGASIEEVTVTVDLSVPANAPLQTIGGSVYVSNPKTPDYPIIVYRKSAAEAAAFSSQCPHQGGVVAPVDAGGFAICTLHGSVFNSGGKLQSGQATRDLAAYPAVLSGTIITITVPGS